MPERKEKIRGAALFLASPKKAISYHHHLTAGLTGYFEAKTGDLLEVLEYRREQ